MASGYRPGGKRTNVGKYKISNNRIAWLKTIMTQIALMRYTEDEMRDVEQVLSGDDYEVGDTLRMMVSTTSGRPYTLNLTAMTEEELKMTRDMFKLCFDMAEPIIKARDKKAAEAYATGDDSFVRSYRQVPQFVIRAGAFRENSKSLLDGLDYAIEGPANQVSPPRELRGSSDEVADGLPSDSSAKNDREETDEPS